VLGMGDDVLVERAAARDEHAERGLPTASHASDLLPEARERPGIAGQHGCVEAPDVDAEFERVRRNDRAYLPGTQPRLDLAAFLGEVARPVASDCAVRSRRERQLLAEVLRQHLDLVA